MPTISLIVCGATLGVADIAWLVTAPRGGEEYRALNVVTIALIALVTAMVTIVTGIRAFTGPRRESSVWSRALGVAAYVEVVIVAGLLTVAPFDDAVGVAFLHAISSGVVAWLSLVLEVAHRGWWFDR